MVEATGFSEMLAHFSQTTWHHIPKDTSLDYYCHMNLKSYGLYYFYVYLQDLFLK
jgi:hypothetical protein